MCNYGTGPSLGVNWSFGADSKPVTISENLSSSPELKDVPMWVVWKDREQRSECDSPGGETHSYQMPFLQPVPEAEHVLLGAAGLRVISGLGPLGSSCVPGNTPWSSAEPHC